MKYEFEWISHDDVGGFRLFLVEILYRTPHLHRDFEVNLILKGAAEIRSQGTVHDAREGDFFVFDPYQPHELRAEGEAVRILSMQISPGFFAGFFPKMESVRFGTVIFPHTSSPRHQAIYRLILESTRLYCRKAPFYELDCAQKISALVRALLDISPFTVIRDADRPAQRTRQERVRFLSERIERGCCEKLLLGDLARELGVNLYYLSHFFHDNFGMSFQEYLSKLRCEKARSELLRTDRSLLDISLSCGFSSPKYFQRAFLAQYGTTPRAYRKLAHLTPSSRAVPSLLTTQVFLSKEESLDIVSGLLKDV